MKHNNSCDFTVEAITDTFAVVISDEMRFCRIQNQDNSDLILDGELYKFVPILMTADTMEIGYCDLNLDFSQKLTLHICRLKTGKQFNFSVKKIEFGLVLTFFF